MKSNRKKLYLPSFPAFVTISLIGLFFGLWFAYMQVNAVSMNALSSYPKQYFLITVIKSYLTIFAFFCLSQFILLRLSFGKFNSFWVASSYVPILFVLVNFPLRYAVSLVLLFQIIILINILRKENYKGFLLQHFSDLASFIIYFLCHLCLTTRFSPLYWKDAILAADGSNSEEIPVVTPIFRGYLLAKQFAFSFFDPAQWGGVMNPPINLSSPFMQLLAFLYDLPSVSYQSYHVLIMAIFFILAILGSFGFYLFLKYGAKLHSLFAFFGGFLFIFSGAPIIAQSFIADAGIFFSPQVVFPYAMLMISLAFSKNDYRYAACAGAALAAQFFFFTPHPEGTIYSVLFYGVYTLGLFLFSWKLSWIHRFGLALLSGVTFLLLSAFILVPIFVDMLSHNMYAFAHTGDIAPYSLEYVKTYTQLLFIFAPISFILLLVYKKLTPIYFGSLFLAISIYFLIHLTADPNFSAMLVQKLHIGLHFWVFTRMGAYYYTSVFIIVMFGLEMIARTISGLILKYIPKYQ